MSGHRLDQAGLALRCFDQALSFLVDRGIVQGEKDQSTNPDGHGRHDKDQQKPSFPVSHLSVSDVI
jgi:hypothetical protein